MKEKEKISTSIEMRLGNVTLSVSVTDNLKREENYLKNFGYIEISNGRIDEEHGCFWDNLEFFYGISAKKFKKECTDELKKGGFDVEETRKDIKRLLKRAFKLNILTN